LSGQAVIDEQDLTRSSLDVTVDPSSIDTREPKRDAHLRSADFFDVEKFPEIRFKSTRIARSGAGLAITGDLTLHGVTRPITLQAELTDPVKSPFGTTVRGASATGKIDRKEFGLAWNAALETGGVLVGEEVTLQIDAELVAK
jgi:polyisoprenoid-binding protein YceI